MNDKYVCKQEVPRSILDGQPEVKDIIIAKNRANIAHKLVEVISDQKVHSIQFLESEEPMQQSVSFVAELRIYM